jgi:hypothetical protein
MSAGRDILEHLSTTLANKVRKISKDEGISAINFIKQTLNKACSCEEERKAKFTQKIVNEHEQTLADAAAGRIQPFHSKEEFLTYLNGLGEGDENGV